MDRMPNKIKRKIHSSITLNFQVLKVLLIKTCKMKPPDLLFIVVFICFYISRYHFSQIFRTSFNIIWRKKFSSRIFLFLRIHITAPWPPWQPKSAKRDKFFLSMLLYTAQLKSVVYMIGAWNLIRVHFCESNFTNMWFWYQDFKSSDLRALPCCLYKKISKNCV